ncbi:Hypothetical predicted protein [Lecanosticta acicola]|uniref:RCC1-like domain-containing protein n=1 Tax=Lecanosticta acicola TaxID=111012 RepID=A0AAI9E7S6_9PEZI|nr:Hypothetical predicted protein [Lecanosticta acicola]
METKIYALGSNGRGQLGMGHQEDTSTPQEVKTHAPIRSRIKGIACGGNHTIVLFEDGTIASTGENDDGRCVNSALGLQITLTNLPASNRSDSGYTDVAATWNATILTNGKEVFSCGSGNSGELGLGPTISTAKLQSKIENFPPKGTTVRKLASCMGHVVAVLSNGEVWGWGKGRKGQLGEPLENRSTPSKVEAIPFSVVNAVCGKDFTCVFGHPSTGELLVLGPSSNDRFGIKENAPSAVPEWKQVCASWGSIYVLLDSGRITAWGRDDHGQLPPPDLPLLRTFAAGSEHCLCVTEAGKVLAWGWGEHGNCGSPTESHGDVKGRWNILETLDRTYAVFSGCATSFILANGPAESQAISNTNGVSG